MPSDPAVITDLDWMPKLDEFAPREDTGLVASREDAHVRTHLDSVTNNHQRCIEDSQAVKSAADSFFLKSLNLHQGKEVEKTPLNSLPIQKAIPPNDDIAPVVRPKRRLHESALPDTAD